MRTDSGARKQAAPDAIEALREWFEREHAALMAQQFGQLLRGPQLVEECHRRLRDLHASDPPRWPDDLELTPVEREGFTKRHYLNPPRRRKTTHSWPRVRRALADLQDWFASRLDGTRKGRNDRQSRGGVTINARMIETIQSQPDAMGWNCRQWAQHLHCGRPAVVATPTWKDLTMRRERDKATRATDRRRRARASEQRRD